MQNLNNGDKLSLLTFNLGLLRLRLFAIDLYHPVPYVDKRLFQIPTWLASSNADIIALQEIYSESYRKYLIEELKVDYPYYLYKRVGRFWEMENGLMIFSKYPICAANLTIFKDVILDEIIFMNKGILSARIVIDPFGEINIFNIHTSSGGAFHQPSAKSIDSIREKQIIHLFNLIKQEKVPSIIMGDLNTGPFVSEGNYELFGKNEYIDAYTEFFHDKKSTKEYTWDPKNSLNAVGPHNNCPPQRIDHIFLPKRFLETARVCDAEIVFDEPIIPIKNKQKITLSDHYGFKVQLIRE